MTPLPAELWENIFSYFECQMPIDKWWLYGSQYDVSPLKDLASLSLVCRTFHPIAQQFMYRTIPIEGFSNHKRHKDLLARSLAENLRLGAYVRNACIDDRETEAVDFEHLLDKPDVSARSKRWIGMTLMDHCRLERNAQLYALMPTLQVVDCSLYADALHLSGMLSGRADIEKIIHSEAVLWAEQGCLYEDEKEEWYRKNPPILSNETLSDNALPSVKELRLRHGDCTDGSLRISDIEPVFLHPSLERLHLLGFDWLSFGLQSAKWPLHQSDTLQVLDLRDCLVDAFSLRNIFPRFRNLHTLHIILGDSRRQGYCDRPEADWDVNLDDMGAVLREHGQNLVSFELHTTEYNSFSSTDGRLGSLRSMTALRHLKVIETDITGRRQRAYIYEEQDTLPLEVCLPPAIETLYLHYEDYYFSTCPPDTQLFVILERTIRSGKVPALREIKVEIFLDDPTAKLRPEIEGWEVEMKEVHLWAGPSSSGCLRTVIELCRVEG